MNAYEMIIAMRTKLVCLVPNCHIFPKRLLTLLAQEGHLSRPNQGVVRFFIDVTFCALHENHRLEERESEGFSLRGESERRGEETNIKPFLATWGSD